MVVEHSAPEQARDGKGSGLISRIRSRLDQLFCVLWSVCSLRSSNKKIIARSLALSPCSRLSTKGFSGLSPDNNIFVASLFWDDSLKIISSPFPNRSVNIIPKTVSRLRVHVCPPFASALRIKSHRSLHDRFQALRLLRHGCLGARRQLDARMEIANSGIGFHRQERDERGSRRREACNR